MYRSDENKKKKNTHSQLAELVLHHFLTESEVFFVFLTVSVLLTVHCAFEIVKFNHQIFRSPADIICQSDVADIRKNAACRLITSMLKGSGFSLGQGTSRVFSSRLHRRHHPDFCPVQLQKSFCKCMLLFYHMVPHPCPHTPSYFFLFFCFLSCFHTSFWAPVSHALNFIHLFSA